MSRNILIILFVIGAVTIPLFIYSQTPSTHPLTPSIPTFENVTHQTTSQVRGVYGILEQGQWNIYSVAINGSKELMTSFDAKSFVNARARDPLTIKLSPDGKYFLYRQNHIQAEPLWLVGISGKDKKIIASAGTNELLKEFLWSPDSKRILYQMYKIPEPCPDCGVPAYSVGGPWYIYDLEKRQTMKLDTTNQIFWRAIAWLNDKEIIFADSKISGITLYDFNAGTAEEFYGLHAGEQLDDTVVKDGKVLVSILPPSFGINYSCDLVVINSERNIDVVLSENNRLCESNYNPNYWLSSGGSKLIYGKGVSPSMATIATSSTDKFGRYVISSIYSLDIQTKKDVPILVGEANKSSFIMGGWDESSDALAVIEWYPINDNELNYILLITDSAGSGKIEIATSENEIPFYGWIRG